MTIYNFYSLAGAFGFILIAYLLSANRKAVNWHVVVWGVGFQFLIAWLLFVLPAGVDLFLWINKAVVALLNCSTAGAKFVFGPLALAPGTEHSLGFIFAFQAMPSIIFFSALMAILYFYNILPVIIRGFAYLFTKLMKVSGAESLCAAANIFVGIESTLTIKPFLKKMTKSELAVVLTAGMATVSSNILAVYVFSLQNVFPKIAGHLVSASLLSAPAALMMAKILLPEEEKPETLGEHVELHIEHKANVLEAIIDGAQAGVKLIVGIVALLIAVLGLVELVDHFLQWAGLHTGLGGHLSLKVFCGYLFYPFTLLLGIPLKDVPIVAQVIGERLVLTEIYSYQHLARLLADGTLKNLRSVVITTYALCGFAHLASLAIFVGGVSAIVPERTRVLAKIGLRCLVAATLACLMTGAVAGIFFVQGSVLLGG